MTARQFNDLEEVAHALHISGQLISDSILNTSDPIPDYTNSLDEVASELKGISWEMGRFNDATSYYINFLVAKYEHENNLRYNKETGTFSGKNAG